MKIKMRKINRVFSILMLITSGVIWAAPSGAYDISLTIVDSGHKSWSNAIIINSNGYVYLRDPVSESAYNDSYSSAYLFTSAGSSISSTFEAGKGTVTSTSGGNSLAHISLSTFFNGNAAPSDYLASDGEAKALYRFSISPGPGNDSSLSTVGFKIGANITDYDNNPTDDYYWSIQILNESGEEVFYWDPGLERGSRTLETYEDYYLYAVASGNFTLNSDEGGVFDFGQSLDFSLEPQSIPIPGGIILIISGLAGLGILRKKRSRP